MEPQRSEPHLSGPEQRKAPASDLARSAPRQPAGQSSKRAGAYTDKPDFAEPAIEEKKRAKWIAPVAAAAVALTVLGLFAVSPSAPNWLRPQPVAAQTEARTLIFTSDDQDRAATEKARAALLRGEVPPELANLPEQSRREIMNGERALFSLRLVDEFNSLVYFHLDGAPVMSWQVSDGRKLLTVALKKGEPALLRLTAARDDGNGVHLVAATSAGELRTRTMAVGESEDWTLLVK